MCIISSLYRDLRKNDHWHDVYEFSVRNDSDELAQIVQVDNESQDDFRAQVQADMRTLRLIEKNGFRLRDKILSFVP